MEVITPNEQELIVGGGWVRYPDGTWVYIPNDEPENENDSINI